MHAFTIRPASGQFGDHAFPGRTIRRRAVKTKFTGDAAHGDSLNLELLVFPLLPREIRPAITVR
jgi:hypothetical protein